VPAALSPASLHADQDAPSPREARAEVREHMGGVSGRMTDKFARAQHELRTVRRAGGLSVRNCKPIERRIIKLRPSVEKNDSGVLGPGAVRILGQPLHWGASASAYRLLLGTRLVPAGS